jgi:hypothetical protein
LPPLDAGDLRNQRADVARGDPTVGSFGQFGHTDQQMHAGLGEPAAGDTPRHLLGKLAVHLRIAGVGQPQFDARGGERLERLLEALQIAGVRDHHVHAVAQRTGQRDDVVDQLGYSAANVAQPSMTRDDIATGHRHRFRLLAELAPPDFIHVEPGLGEHRLPLGDDAQHRSDDAADALAVHRRGKTCDMG